MYLFICMMAYWACPAVAAWLLWVLRWRVTSDRAQMAVFFVISWALVGVLALAGVPYPRTE
jgi:hypothetical protein